MSEDYCKEYPACQCFCGCREKALEGYKDERCLSIDAIERLGRESGDWRASFYALYNWLKDEDGGDINSDAIKKRCSPPRRCEQCDGRGWYDGECPACKGSGKVDVPAERVTRKERCFEDCCDDCVCDRYPDTDKQPRPVT